VHSQTPSPVRSFHSSFRSSCSPSRSKVESSPGYVRVTRPPAHSHPGGQHKLRVPFQRVSTPASTAATIAAIVKQVAAGECTRAPELQGLQKVLEEEQ
jgi:hypothetical protein